MRVEVRFKEKRKENVLEPASFDVLCGEHGVSSLILGYPFQSQPFYLAEEYI